MCVCVCVHVHVSVRVYVHDPRILAYITFWLFNIAMEAMALIEIDGLPFLKTGGSFHDYVGHVLTRCVAATEPRRTLTPEGTTQPIRASLAKRGWLRVCP